MADIFEIAGDLGIKTPDNTNDGGNDEDNADDFLANAAIEDRVNELFSQEDTSKEQPPKENNDDALAGKEDKRPPVEDQKKQDQAPPTFQESSEKTFLNNDGEIDIDKVSGYFLDKKNSIDFSTIKDDSLSSIKEPEKLESPEDKYYKDVSGIVESLPDIIKDEQSKGYTPEQTLQRLVNTFGEMGTSRENRRGFLSEQSEITKQYKAELDQIREEKINTRIKANTSELGAHYDNLIPGFKGVEVLNSFMLEKKYGGKMLDTLFRKDNPDFEKLSEDERKSTTEKWFKNFQSSKTQMAMVAEFGRSMWILEQLPGIIQHSQKIGATKKANEKESQIGKPSEVNRGNRGGSSGLDEFFGYDSVN